MNEKVPPASISIGKVRIIGLPGAAPSRAEVVRALTAVLRKPARAGTPAEGDSVTIPAGATLDDAAVALARKLGREPR